MELPLAEVVLSPRLHLRKAYVLERRPFSFCQSQTDCLGIRAPLKGRGGSNLSGAPEQSSSRGRSGNEAESELKEKGACGTWRAEQEPQPKKLNGE